MIAVKIWGVTLALAVTMVPYYYRYYHEKRLRNEELNLLQTTKQHTYLKMCAINCAQQWKPQCFNKMIDHASNLKRMKTHITHSHALTAAQEYRMKTHILTDLTHALNHSYTYFVE